MILPLASPTGIFANPVFWWGSVLVGAVLLVTAVTGFCPAYRLFGVRTCNEC